MKAFLVSDFSWEWYSIFHAETRGEAKMLGRSAYGFDVDYIDMRARRIPGLDDKPITWENAKNAGFQYTDESWEPIEPEAFYNDCRCEICRPPGAK